LNDILSVELQCVFWNWIERVTKVIDAGEDCFPSKYSHRHCFILDWLLYGYNLIIHWTPETRCSEVGYALAGQAGFASFQYDLNIIWTELIDSTSQ
jgi:hypothetical protein